MGSMPWSQIYNATGTASGMLGSTLERYQNAMIVTSQMAQRSMNWLLAITVALPGFSTATPAVEGGCEVAVSDPIPEGSLNNNT